LPNSILIVDDNEIIRRTLHRLLESKAGWEVCGEAADGKEGIEKAERLKPDLIVLDMSMPGMDGITAAKVLKNQMPTLPIIMFTNFAEDQFLKHEVLEAGITKVVSKTDPNALLLAVEDALRASPTGFIEVASEPGL
jgi:two-component system, NarL family, response regulator NreC